jgi:hypothetical protein
MSKRALARLAKVDLAQDAAFSGLPKAVACAAKTGAAWRPGVEALAFSTRVG